MIFGFESKKEGEIWRINIFIISVDEENKLKFIVSQEDMILQRLGRKYDIIYGKRSLRLVT